MSKGPYYRGVRGGAALATRTRALAAAARDVKELLAEGQPPERIAAAIETVRRRATRAPAGPGGTP